MATVTITCGDQGPPFTEGATISLLASVDGGTATGWEWTLDGKPQPASGSSCSVVVATDTSGAWVATASLDGGAKVSSAPFHVATKPPAGNGGGGGGQTTDTPPWFDTKFAGWAALVGVGIAVILVVAMGLFDHQLRLSDTEWGTLDARAKVANRIVLPIVVLGAIAVLVGMWMAVVEWRGRFEKPKAAGPLQPQVKGVGDDAAKVIDSVGKLRGAALVMVVGALLMFAAAWVTQSTAKPPASPTTTPSATDPP